MRRILIVLLVTVCRAASAQEVVPSQVTLAEVEQKFHPQDTSAPAAILYRKGKTHFELSSGGWRLVTEVQTRIKIYNKAGYDYATKEFVYPSYDDRISYQFYNAFTYNLVDGYIEKTVLGPEGEFTQPLNEYRTSKKIVLPNIREGSVIEYTYKMVTPSFARFPDWFFQYTVPVNYIDYEVIIPTYFTYRNFLSGKADIKQTPAHVIKTKHYSENVVNYYARNVRAFKEEAFVNNIENYMSVLKHELTGAIFDNGETEFHFSTDWHSVARQLHDDEDFGKQLSYAPSFKKYLKEIVPPQIPDSEKAELIFNFVKSRMTWDEWEGYLARTGVRTAYQSQVGNAADINLMLVAMLREAGFEANPVLLSTRSNGLANYPSLQAYDYVIAAIEDGDKITLYDATSKQAAPNILPLRALNWMGRLIMEDGTTKEVDLTPQKSSREVINISAAIDASGTVTGRIRDQYFDYYAFTFRETYGGNKEEHMQKLAKQYDGLIIDDYTVAYKDITKPVVEDYTFTHNNIADVAGNKIYISPMLFFAKTENPFKSETREYPVDFLFPFEDKYIINITIPEGYVVEYLPVESLFSMGQNLGSFKYSVAQARNQIQLSVTFDINYAIVLPNEYAELRGFFEKMMAKQNEKIILKKA